MKTTGTQIRFAAAAVASAALAALLAGCATQPSGPMATASLRATTGNTTTGTVRFAQSGSQVLVTGTITGLKPGAEHGFHVHEKGDCSSGDGMSTGGHFNPTSHPHGRHGMGTHHTGDLPSLKADANGSASFSFASGTLSVGSGVNDVVGKGLIVHRDPDDYRTQPTGNAGPRLACAVISRS
ncbi:superoxide dismutase family protein [Caenimonas sp. SL110]|uniref:superoxide dismutase family protein n=1 Tax=Caenimonas sp. SL110 TaxID=1450524 RepID=UPI000653AC3C|nr:superoxide dismutase family protein [Caenimonas sp. SL110]